MSDVLSTFSLSEFGLSIYPSCAEGRRFLFAEAKDLVLHFSEEWVTHGWLRLVSILSILRE